MNHSTKNDEYLSFGALNDLTISTNKFFDKMRLWGRWGHWSCWGCWGHWGCRHSKAWKILLGTSESPRYLNSALFWCLKKYFLGVESRNIKLNFSTFSVRGCWGQPMLLFWKLVDETQMGNPRDHAARDISSTFSIFLPLRAISKKPYHYETPCTTVRWKHVSKSNLKAKS